MTLDPTQQDPQEPAGQPDLAIAHEKLKANRDEWKAKAEAAAAREADLQAKLSQALTADDVAKAVADAKAEAEAAQTKAEETWAAEKKSLAITNALLAEGCIDDKAAIAHIDLDKVAVAPDGHISGLDVAKIKSERAYLFGSQNTISTGGSAGGAGKTITRDEIMAIKDTTERQSAIAANLDLFN